MKEELKLSGKTKEGKHMKGTVKWFSKEKGYGFITNLEKTDVFVHYSGIMADGFKCLESGQTVEFDIVDTEKGKQAVNVSVIAELPETIVEEDDTTMSKEITENDVVGQVTGQVAEAFYTMALASMVTDAIEKVIEK